MNRRRAGKFIAFVLSLALILSTCVGAQAATYKTLRKGDSNNEVKTMQQALVALGYDTKGVDGKFGPGTESAVRAFQQSKSLTVDGIAGTKTLTALYGASEGSGTGETGGSESGSSGSTGENAGGGTGGNTTRTLRKGDSGSDVKNMQQALVSLGYSTNGVDGKFGNGTYQAVRAFQSTYKLGIDGVAGPKTLTKLYSLTPGSGNTGEGSGGDDTGSGSGSGENSGGTVSYNRVIRLGYEGDDVAGVQTRLAELGYYTQSVTGKCDNNTLSAVKAFQANNALTADGLAGPNTFKILFSDGAKSASETPAVTYTTLKLNATGTAVENLQNALKELKYSVTVNSTYDAATRSAVIEFQMINGLVGDGIAGQETQALLYSGNAKDANAGYPGLEAGAGEMAGPSKSSIQLLHWFDDVKPSAKSGQTYLVYDPVTGLGWTLRFYSLGRHADSEPLTLRDTLIMNKAFGTTTWTPKIVYAKLPDGRWTIASMHNTPHLTGGIEGNGFDGHLCVHFLRDMDETQKNDPSYGVTNQNAIRAAWKNLTGETYVEVVR